MRFSIIYTCDVPARVSLSAPPPSQSHLWNCTEKDGGPEGGQMDWGFEDNSKWARGRHRKYCGLLNKKQFEEFLSHTGLFMEDIETMGSIGAPGFGWGWAPAVSFRNDDPTMIQSAYVTPVPDGEPKREVTPEQDERNWNRIRSAMLKVYGV